MNFLNKITTTAMLILSILLTQSVFGEQAKYDLSTYPYPFKESNVLALVGAWDKDNQDTIASINIMSTLGHHSIYVKEVINITPEAQKPDTQGIPQITGSIVRPDFKSIVVGGPCSNKASAFLMNISQKWPECASGFEKGKGVVRLYQVNETPYLLVAGHSGEDTRKVAYVLSNYAKYKLNGTALEVSGTLANLSVKRIKQNSNQVR